jgi:putative DNA primase/helicase
MNLKNAFAKIDEAELVALPDADVSKVVGAATVITPVPAHATPVEQAVLSLGRKKPDHLWKYFNETGELVFAVARWNDATGKKVSFLPISWVRDANGLDRFAFKHQVARRPLYGLLDLQLRPDAPVVVVEGEKCADAARGVFPEAVVITSPGGSNAAYKADWTPLRGRTRVVIWGDADDAGLKYAQDVAQNVAGLDVGEILIVDAKKLASTASSGTSRNPVPGWDVADALAEGWHPDELRKAVFACASRYQGARRFLSFGSFAMNEKGLIFELPPKGKDEEGRMLWISAPFEVLGRIRDPKGEGWARLLCWRDDDGRVHTHSISDAELHCDQGSSANLASRGLKVSTGPNRSHLIRYLNEASVDNRVTVETKLAGTR